MQSFRRSSTRLKRKKERSEPPPPVEVPCPRGTNVNGLPILPDELLLEIMSYYPPISLPTMDDNLIDTEAHNARRDTLLALSRTCSNLRRFFRPYIWQRIEVCAGMQVGEIKLARIRTNRHTKEFALELIRQLEIVTIRDSSLAQHVNIVNVEITEYSIRSVLLELARCMCLFDNLHTVKLRLGQRLSFLTHPDEAIRQIFREYTYPQIRNVIISPDMRYFLESCPQVRSIRCSYIWTITFLASACHCHLLEDVRIPFIPLHYEAVSTAFPQLRDITLDIRDMYRYPVSRDHLASLSRLTRLQTIRLICWYPSGQEAVRGVKWAKDLLLKLQQQDKEEKRIVTQYHSPPSSETIILESQSKPRDFI